MKDDTLKETRFDPIKQLGALLSFLFVLVFFNSQSEKAYANDKVSLIKNVGCGSCHHIPGIDSANGRVGPSLSNYQKRIYIAGVLPNTFNNLVEWLLDPQKITPGTAMPDSGLNKEQAEIIASYLLDY